jgi:4-hydroxybenzoate polyprenyltransferase
MSACYHPPVHALRTIAADIKIAHSVFALPFAVLAAFMAAAPEGWASIDGPRFAGQLGLIVAAMVLARTAAMLANRLLDRTVDADNPRTAGRALPSGRLAPTAAIGVLATSIVLFVVVCAGFGVLYGNWWPTILALPVLAWICAYPLTKRFTALCHVYLGTSLALSPLAAALAVEPTALATQPALWLLALMVLGWVAGFDIIYALQDVDVDRRSGLFSIPARLGVVRGLWVSRLLHAIAAASLIAATVLDPRLAVMFAVGVAIVIALLVWEPATVARWGTSKIALAFFTLNGAISCVLGVLGSLDIVVT